MALRYLSSFSKKKTHYVSKVDTYCIVRLVHFLIRVVASTHLMVIIGIIMCMHFILFSKVHLKNFKNHMFEQLQKKHNIFSCADICFFSLLFFWQPINKKCNTYLQNAKRISQFRFRTQISFMQKLIPSSGILLAVRDCSFLPGFDLDLVNVSHPKIVGRNLIYWAKLNIAL